MEDPIRFDLWCDCGRVARDEIVSYLRRLPLNPTPAAPDSKRFAGQQMFLKFHGRSWRLVKAIRDNPPPWLVRMAVFQESYCPANEATLQYCESHDFHYAGVIGCHVCTGFYEGNTESNSAVHDSE
jgi:hypothetical protein